MKLYAGIFAKPPEKVVLHRIKDPWSHENFPLTGSTPVNSKEIP